MKLRLLFLLIIGSIANGHANTLKDSLINVLHEKTSADEIVNCMTLIINEVDEITALNDWVEKATPYLRKCLSDSLIFRFKFKEGDLRLSLLDYGQGMNVLLETLKAAEQQNDSITMSAVNNRIGVHYFYVNEKALSLDYMRKGVAQYPSYGSELGYANRLSALGAVTYTNNNIEEGLKFQLEAVEIRRRIGDLEGLPTVLSNLAEIYFDTGDRTKAYQYLNESIQLSDSLGIPSAKTYTTFLLGEFYRKSNDYQASIVHYEMAIDWWEHNAFLKDLPNAYESVLKSYKAVGQKDSAIATLEKYLVLKDTVYNLTSLNVAKEFESKYNAEKQELLLIKEKQERVLEQNETELENASQERKLLIAIATALLLIFIIIYVYIRYKSQTKDKQTLLLQNELIETKNREIGDSINYAKRIQNSLLPSVHSINEIFEGAFVLYLPKDTVAGDFYWMEKTEDTLLIAAADCTGHGVPGAMLSVVCTNGLNSAVRQYKLTSPAAILDKTRDIVVEQFAESAENISDGMDISLCAIQNNVLKFSGAYNPIWIVRNKAFATEEELIKKGNLVGEKHFIIEHKGDKQPIGMTPNPIPFTETTVHLQKGDLVYLLTDGYADQFGGLNQGIKNGRGKKFKQSRLKHLILDNCTAPLVTQKEILHENLKLWQGALEQLDDICVIGIKV